VRLLQLGTIADPQSTRRSCSNGCVENGNMGADCADNGSTKDSSRTALLEN